MPEGKQLRIVYMGTPDFAVEPLRRLVEGGYNVVSVVTMPDKPSGRGQKMTASAVKNYAVSQNIPVLQPEKLRDENFISALKELKPDLGIVVAFRMLPTAVWSLPALGTFNLHASLLPDYRGAAPINWAVMNGDKKSGVTTFMLDKDIDTGDIIAVKEVEISDSDTVGTLHDKLMDTGGGLVLDTVEIIASGKGRYVPQQEIETGRELRPAPKIFKEDCRIDWSCDINDIRNKVRGLSPYPAAWFEHNGQSYKVFDVTAEPADIQGNYGDLITDNKAYIKVVSKGGYTIINDLQAAGKKRMPVAEFLRGNRI